MQDTSGFYSLIFLLQNNELGKDKPTCNRKRKKRELWGRKEIVTISKCYAPPPYIVCPGTLMSICGIQERINFQLSGKVIAVQ
jgi:hypothetical protein